MGRVAGWRRFGKRSAAAGAAMLLSIPAASAQVWWDTVNNGIPDISFATSLPYNGDPHGVRKRLGDLGVVYGLEYTNDTLGNLRGGTRTGWINQGKLQGILTIDFEKLAGWEGLTFFGNFFQLHNTGRIRRDYVGGINTIAAIEAVPTTRLSEVWVEQKFAGGQASVRAGQLAADSEFFFSELSTIFLQSDWPTIAAVNLPSGGAAYPLSTPGVRLKLDPNKDLSLLVAMLNGNPAGPGLGDPELRNRYGLNFRMRDPAFFIGEVQVRRNQGRQDRGLATEIKLGAWGQLGLFDDYRFANDGTLLADPSGSGVPLQHRNDWGVYGIIDQQIYRLPGGDAQSGISVYSRVSVSPNDRNLVNFYADGGIIFAGLIPPRPNDKFGAAIMHSRFSNSVRGFNRDTIAFTGIPGPIRDYETNLELMYAAQIVPGWIVQPDLQFVWHPAGNSAKKTATVAGVRSLWRY